MADGSGMVLEGEVIMPGDPIPPVVVQPSPFRVGHYHMTVVAGSSLEDMVLAAGYRAEQFPSLQVYIGDQAVSPALWRLVRPKKGAQVFIQARVRGRNAARMVAMFAIMVVAFMVAGPGSAFIEGLGDAMEGTAISSAMADTILAAAQIAGMTAIATAGQYLVNALIPPPKSSSHYGFDQQLGNPYGQITGMANQAAPYGPIPRIYGKKRLYPMLAARPYTETVGNDQYLRLLLMVGYGPLRIDPANLKIGETPITSVGFAEYEILEGWPTDAAPSLFTKNIQEDVYQILLGDLGDSVTKTTHPNTTEVSIDLTALGGLMSMDSKGGINNQTVMFTVEWSVAAANSWNNAVWIAGGSSYGTGSSGVLNMTDKSQAAVRRSGRFQVGGGTPGLYDVRVTRTTSKSPSTRVSDQIYFTTLRSIVSGDPAPMKGIAYISMRLKATGQLNGAPDNINCIAEAYVPVLNTTTGVWTPTITRNPGWAYIDLMRRRGLSTLIADSRIDLDPAGPLLQWVAACDSTPAHGAGPYWTFDGTFEGGSIFTALQQVASNGRAAFNLRDGKYSVTQDKSQTVPVQHITPRNSWGYSGSKAFVDVPHAFRVRFLNEAKGYAEDEVVVYQTGYNKDGSSGLIAAQKFETLELPGCCRADQAWREGMYHMAVVMLRPEQHMVSMDVENVRCSMGDLVRFSHDVILVGLGHGRVLSRTVVGPNVTTYTLDSPVTMVTGKSYVMRFRTASGVTAVLPINTVNGDDQPTVTLTTPLASGSAPDVGDLFMFGEAGLESAPMMVRKIEPGPDLTAKITLVDAQNGVWTADNGIIPAFQSFITTPTMANNLTPPPIDFDLTSGGTTFALQPDGTVRGRIGVSLQPIVSTTGMPVDSIEVQYQNASSPDWKMLPRYGRETATIWIEDVISGDNYSVRARTISPTGYTSPWTTHLTQANGKAVPPGAPTALTVTGGDYRNQLAWTNPLDYDLDHTEVWAATTNNRASATLIASVPSPAAKFVHDGLAANAQWFYWVRAVDSSANVSAAYYPASATAGVSATTGAGSTHNNITMSSGGPGSPVDGDIWVQLDGNSRPISINTRVAGSWVTSGTANKITSSSGAPSGPTVNDIWVVLNGSGAVTGIQTWTGSAWVATATRNSITSAFSAPTAPTPVDGDVWVQIDASSRVIAIHTRVGGVWVQSSTNNKITSGSSTGGGNSTPTVNDIWVDTTTSGKPVVKIWNGSAWAASSIPVNVVQYFDATSGRMTTVIALPGVNYATGMGLTFSSYPFTSDSGNIYVGACTLAGEGFSRSLSSQTISGLASNQIYGMVYQYVGNFWGACDPGSATAFINSTDLWIYAGQFSTQAGGGGYPTPVAPTGVPGGYAGFRNGQFNYSQP